MNSRLLTFFLVVIDWLSSFLAWGTFYYFRKTIIEHVEFSVDDSFYLGLLAIPLVWLFIYLLQGTYQDVRHLFRTKIITISFVASVIGTICIFFLFLLDDKINDYQQYYYSLMLLFGIHFFTTLIPRFVFVSIIVKRIHTRKTGFKTLIIGGSEKAVDIYKEIIDLPKGTGNLFEGFVNINGIDKLLEKDLPYLGHIDNIEAILRQREIEEVIIAVESTEHDRIKKIVSRLEGSGVKVRILPDMYDILAGSVDMTNIFGALLMTVNSDRMSIWQKTVKRVIDVLISIISLLFLLPVFLVLAIMVKTSSPGSIFFLQNRIGKNGRIFKIIKFRTMYMNSEKEGPQLSSSSDSRITKIGKIMRKTRLDEFPQFLNVLIGDMSLVGPRPERQFYIDQIAAIEPQFLELTKVRPGITSWGQVKYGYAENVEQMLDRMKFDLLYLKNRSLSIDFKIMLFTILIVFKGAGK